MPVWALNCMTVVLVLGAFGTAAWAGSVALAFVLGTVCGVGIMAAVVLGIIEKGERDGR